jgi:pimeloyl-ACP methyl ester carboxylesterase
MNRRNFLIALALLAAGCATSTSRQPASFQSDRISVVTQGSGPDVVLIPGLGSTPEVWRETVAAVPGYRYHLVQLNGFAGRPAGGNANGLVTASSAEEIARYIREAGLSRPALIGHSMGGTMGMMVAARNPDLVSKLMVVDMIPFMGMLFGPPGSTADSVRPVADQLRDAALARSSEAREKAVTESMAPMVKTEARRAEAVRHSLESDVGVSARSLHELITTDLRPELAAIKVPVTVLYVRGPNIPLTDEQMDAVYKVSFANVPQTRLKRITDSYHFIMWDKPAEFAAEVREFLGG